MGGLVAYLSFWARDWGGRFLFAMVSRRGIMPRMFVRLLWTFMFVVCCSFNFGRS